MIKVFAIAISSIFLFYLFLPIPSYPIQPPDSVQSLEQADTETQVKRAYFTNYTRDQAFEHYKKQFTSVNLLGLQIPLPIFKLVHPPEDAFRLIRDQTRSTGLDEIVQPLRVSFFVNNFVAKEAKDAITYQARPFERKITVKYASPNIFVRVVVTLLSIYLLYLILGQWLDTTKALVRKILPK